MLEHTTPKLCTCLSLLSSLCEFLVVLVIVVVVMVVLFVVAVHSTHWTAHMFLLVLRGRVVFCCLLCAAMQSQCRFCVKRALKHDTTIVYMGTCFHRVLVFCICSSVRTLARSCFSVWLKHRGYGHLTRFAGASRQV